MRNAVALLLDYACAITHPLVWRLPGEHGCWLLNEFPPTARLWRWANA